MEPHVHVSRHPVVLDRLGQLRDVDTPPPAFRSVVRQLTHLLFAEASSDLDTRPTTVKTPLAECPGQRLAHRLGVVPILRAGLGMADALVEMIPEARVWHLGLFRDHETLQPVTYYNKLPPQVNVDVAFVVDPMLATGGSAVAAVDILKRWGCPRIKYLGLIAAPEGVKALTSAHPDVSLYLAALDSHLNERGYIVPGLGDAGDRQFDTF
jgi:uracil phosphoribosyltransferase